MLEKQENQQQNSLHAPLRSKRVLGFSLQLKHVSHFWEDIQIALERITSRAYPVI